MQVQAQNFSGISVNILGIPSINFTGLLTGIFYPYSGNPAGYVTSESGGSIISVTGNPITSGDMSGIGGTLVIASGNYILVSGGASSNTGQLTGVFYPLNSNPSSYITAGQTGNFVTTGQTGNFLTNVPTGQLTGAFYPLISNPASYVTSSQTGGFVTTGHTGIFVTTGQTGSFITTGQTGNFGGGGSYNQSGTYIFNTQITSGVTQQFISFPTNLGSNPYVIPSLVNISGNENISVWTSGIFTTGYWAQFSWPIDSSGYTLTTLAAISSITGLATTVIINGSGSSSSLIVTGYTVTGNITLTGISGITLTTGNSSEIIFGINTGLFYPASNPNNYGTGLGGVTLSGNANYLYLPPLTNNLTDNINVTLNWSLADHFYITLTGNSNIIFTGTRDAFTIVVGSKDTGAGYTILFPTGSGNNFSGINWPGGTGSIPTQSSGHTDIYTFTQFNSQIYVSYVQNF